MESAIDAAVIARPLALHGAFPDTLPPADADDADIRVHPVLYGMPDETPDHIFEMQLIEHKRLFEVMLMLRHDIEASARLIAGCLNSGRKIILCCDAETIPEAQRFAAKLTSRMMGRTHDIAAIALLPDASSSWTSSPGDHAQDDCHARQVEDMGREGDCLLAISVSGDSPSLVNAVKAARKSGIATMSLSGEGGPLNRICDQVMAIPASSAARIQEAHVFIVHALCALVEAHLKS